jgi:hypothetical protein
MYTGVVRETKKGSRVYLMYAGGARKAKTEIPAKCDTKPALPNGGDVTGPGAAAGLAFAGCGDETALAGDP